MINEAREKLENTLRHNDSMREEERVPMAQNTIIISSESLSSDDLLKISSDDSSDSGRRKIPTKPFMSSNISSPFSAKQRSENKETPLKQPHQDAFKRKQETLEIIKRLHINCCFLGTEHLFMLPKNCLYYQQYEDVHVEITKNI